MIKISTLQVYNEPTTLEHIKALDFNRTATSTGETEAVNYIETCLSDKNIKTEVEHFQWTGPLRILMRTSYVVVFSYFLLYRLFLVIILYFVIKYMFETFRRVSLIRKEESKNIFTKISAKNLRPNRPLVIFSAHYDSMSANLPYKVQVVVFFIYRMIVIFYGLMIVVFATIFILDYFFHIPFKNFMILLVTITSLAGVFISIPILYLVFIEKPSSGSVDNASGVAILIELAKLINENPLENIDVLFIWTGAEEWGLKGSKRFCKSHFNALDQTFDLDKSFNINIDMVGSYIGLLDKSGFIIKRKMNRELNDILEATANQLHIPLERYKKIIKPQSDYKSFKKYAKSLHAKFQVSCFHSSRDSKYIHSVRDTPDRCSVEALNGCLNICHQTLRSIDLRG
ncbi:MAG: M28 family metallopeptidase [Candidatus Thorarchaeota archaeon]